MVGVGGAFELGLGLGVSGGTNRANGIGGKEEKSSGNSFGGSIAVCSAGGGGGGGGLNDCLVPGKIWLRNFLARLVKRLKS